MAEADEKRILKIRRCVVHSISGNSVNIVKDEEQEIDPPQEVEHTVTFDANGGTTETGFIKVYGRIGEDIYLSVYPSAHRQNFEWTGWFTEREGGQQVHLGITKITEDVTFYAHWQAESWTIGYNMNGHGEVPKNAKVSYTIEDAGYCPLPPAPVQGWEFLGWRPEYIPYEFQGDILFTAQWKAVEEPQTQKFTVVFMGNGGSPERTIIKVDPNGKIRTLPEPYERTGYEFQGWYPSPEGNGQCLTTSTIIDSDRTYYAFWLAQTCYIVYDAQGGTSWESTAVPYMSEVEELSNATRAGYEFLGWFTEPDGGTQITAGYVMTSLDGMRVYAHWRKIDEGGEEQPEPPDILNDPEVQQRFEEIRQQYPFPDGFIENTEEEVEEIDQELENELDDEEDQTSQLCETNEDDENDDSWNDLLVETPEWALVRRANI